jgi:RNA polymerase sigma factor for flagellar operon FliA
MRESKKLAPQREALLLCHAGLVRRIAYHLFQRRNYVDVDDLIQVGMVELRAAIVGYGHDAAAPFEAYASVRIRGAMLDFVRKSDWSLHSGRRDLRGIEDLKPASLREPAGMLVAEE